jgi:O-antigen/teichoic acid export membrane protein
MQDSVTRTLTARQAIVSLLSRGPLTRSVGLVATGHAAAYAVTLLATPLLTRLYSPAEFGMFSCYSGLFSLIGTGICLRYDAAIPLPASKRAGQSLMWLAALMALCCAVSWGAILHSFGYALRDHPWVAAIAPYMIALAANLLFYGCSQILTFWATRTGQFARLAQQRLILVLSVIAAQLSASWSHPQTNGLITGQLIGYFVAVLATCWLLREGLTRRPSMRRLRSAAWRYRRLPQYTVLSETLHVSQSAVPPLLLAALFGNAAAGWFLLAWRIVGAPVTLLVVPIARVYYSVASRIDRDRRQDLEQFFWRTLIKSALVATPGIVAIAVVAPTLVPWLLGESWRPSGRYCQLLCPLLLCHLFAVSVRPTFDVTNRQDLQLIASLIGAALTLTGLLAPYVLNLGATAAIVGMSAGGCASHGIAILLSWWSIRSTGGERAWHGKRQIQVENDVQAPLSETVTVIAGLPNRS